jgi:hypothetical protein
MDQLATISHNLLDGGLKIQQAAVHFSELQPRFDGANHLPANLQNQLTSLSRTYLDTVDAGLNANEQILHSLGLDSASNSAGLPESISSGEDMAEVIHRYQQFCRELISSKGDESRSAAAIADELMNSSARIRLCLAHMSASIPRAHNQ